MTITLVVTIAFAQVAYAAWLYTVLTTVSINGGEILGFGTSRDGRSVIYWADADVNDQYEVYSVPIRGGTVNKLNGPMTPGGDVSSFTNFVPDRLVYMADQDVDERVELYSVPYTSGPAIKLNGNLIPDGDVRGWSVSGDYGRIVYSADQEADERVELYGVPIVGGVPNKLNMTLAVGDSVRNWAASSALGEVAYNLQSGTTPGLPVTLYRVPITGGATLTLTIPITTGQSLLGYFYSPDGSRLLYQAGILPFGRLYSIKPDGTDVQALSSGAILPNSGFTHDGQSYIYASGDPLALYVVPITGGMPTKLTADGGGGVIERKLSPDGSRVVYWAYEAGNGGPRGLYSVPVTGGAVTPLHSAPVEIYNSSHFQITLDSNTVVYLGANYQVLAVPIAGGTSVPLAGSLSGHVFSVVPNSDEVLFIDDLEIVNVQELYSVPITGGTPQKISRPLTAVEDIYGFFLVTADGQSVVYRISGGPTYNVRLEVAYQPSRVYLPLIIR